MLAIAHKVCGLSSPYILAVVEHVERDLFHEVLVLRYVDRLFVHIDAAVRLRVGGGTLQPKSWPPGSRDARSSTPRRAGRCSSGCPETASRRERRDTKPQELLGVVGNS